MTSQGAEAAANGKRTAAFVYLVLTVTCVTCADLFLKKGASASSGETGLIAESGIGAFASLFTIVGICFHLAGLFCWMAALKRLPLTIAYCFTALQQVTIALGAWLWLQEKITPMRWGGIALVCAGVLFLVPAIASAERLGEGERK